MGVSARGSLKEAVKSRPRFKREGSCRFGKEKKGGKDNIQIPRKEREKSTNRQHALVSNNLFIDLQLKK